VIPGELLKREKWPERQFRNTAGGLHGYSSAYSDAARQLASDHEIGGVWALPIVFLYRHALELLVKATLTEASPLVSDICLKRVLKRSHNLKKHLPDLRVVAALYGLELSATLTGLILAWHKHDEKGMKARYPINPSGEVDALENGERFNLKLFVADCEMVVEEVRELLLLVENSRYAEFLKDTDISN
jgi:hypothetical protein